MARRRLTPATGFGVAEPAPAPEPGHRLPPIAQVAHAAATEAAISALTERLRSAREGGSLVIDIPLEDIDEGHLTRDRLTPVPGDESLAALCDSLAAHGQRMPVEVIPREEPGRPFGLLSGLRRLTALRLLRESTGEPRFATIRALIRRPASAAEAYVAMVEENEVREGLSYFERARMAALTTDMGVFESEKAALLALFASASRARRSKIRSFLPIYRDLGDALRFPAAIPERLGLRLAAALRDHGPAVFRADLAAARPRSPAEEEAVLTLALRSLPPGPANAMGPPPAPRGHGANAPGPAGYATSAPGPTGYATSAPGPTGDRTPLPDPAAQPWEPPARPVGTSATLRPGLALASRRRGQSLTLTLSGDEVTEHLCEQAIALLTRGLARR